MSSILYATQDKSKSPFLQRVFEQDPNTPNFITVLLSRLKDPDGISRGEFTIGEVVPGFESITSMPQLPVVTTIQPTNQHWLGTIDGIFVNDVRIPTNSSVLNSSSGELIALYDTGFTFPQVPPSLSSAMYSNIPGAQFDTEKNWWKLPCDQEVNITFVIGGMRYPIHPMDASVELRGDNGSPLCVGSVRTKLSLHFPFC